VILLELESIAKKYFVIVALLLILLLSYQIRAVNILPDKILSFDPVFQYRFTKFFADHGFLPDWDELTYYVGRPFNNLTQPLMYYLTAFLYKIQPFGWSLLTTAAYASAWYGALIIIPAFLLGRELSNRYGGLLAAILVGTAPSVLVRTFGSSYDTDQFVLFFILLSLYLGFRAIRKRDIYSLHAFMEFVHLSVFHIVGIRYCKFLDGICIRTERRKNQDISQ